MLTAHCYVIHIHIHINLVIEIGNILKTLYPLKKKKNHKLEGLCISKPPQKRLFGVCISGAFPKAYYGPQTLPLQIISLVHHG